MVKCHVGVLQADFSDHVFPELEGFQHIGLVDTGHPFAAFARGLERHMRDAFDLGARIAHCVEGFLAAGEMAVGRNTAATRLAEVNVAGQFANDEDVQPRDQFALQTGCIDQLRVANCRAEVGKQTQVFAQTQNRLLGP